MKKTELTRRNFIKQSAVAGSALFVPASGIANNLMTLNRLESDKLNVFIFSKALQFLDYTNMSEAVKEMGYDGIDLTVRPKGHVLPENVEEDLPKATEAMKSYDLLASMLSTNIADASAPVSIKVLETASQLGYQYYRTAWFRYNRDEEILKSLDFAKQHLSELAELNKKLKISGAYHNHSGNYMGAAIWDLHQVLENLSPKYMGSQYDIMHATIEGGKNWEYNFMLIKPYINSIVVKDFAWKKINGKWSAQYVPLGEGMVDLKKFFSLLKKYNINVPISIHVEFDLGGAEHGKKPTIDSSEVLARIKKELDYVRETWAKIS